MADLSPDFQRVLEAIFKNLGTELKRPRAFEAVLDASASRVRVAGDRVLVPVRFEVHWRRFRTVPPELVREAAYEAMKTIQMPAPDEADCHAFAEKFMRDELLWSD